MPVDRVKELVQEGLRRKLMGDLIGAAQIWTEALVLEPGNARAREGIEVLRAQGIAVQSPGTQVPQAELLGSTLGSNPFTRPVGDQPPWTMTPSPFTAPRPASPPASPPSTGAQPPSEAREEPSVSMDPPHAATAAAVLPEEAREIPWFASPSPEAEEVDVAAALALPIGGDPALVALDAPHEEPLPLDPGAQGEAVSGQKTPPQPPDQVRALLERAMELIELDDCSGALAEVERAVQLDPSNLTAQELRNRCEETLCEQYDSKIGDRLERPGLKMKREEIVWLNLDHRAGFLLSLIDGQATFEDLFALSGMTELETARILAMLIEENLIGPGGA
jgi:hypothetical protein